MASSRYKGLLLTLHSIVSVCVVCKPLSGYTATGYFRATIKTIKQYQYAKFQFAQKPNAFKYLNSNKGYLDGIVFGDDDDFKSVFSFLFLLTLYDGQNTS